MELKPVTETETAKVPGIVLAVHAEEVAIPEELVDEVKVEDPVKEQLAPLLGAVKVTGTFATKKVNKIW